MITKKKEQELEKIYQKREAEKNEFFLAASHQLKAPLAIIQWCLQSVLESSKLDNQSREYVTKSVEQAAAMTQLVTDMLHVFRLVSRKGKPQTYTAVHLNDLVDQIFHQYEVMATNHKVHLVKGPMESVPPLFVDEPYFRQALINLVDNAIKYSPDGGAITVSAHTHGKHLEIDVEDHGIGMTEAELAKIFTEFYRSEEARQIAHEGTGLGLVLVKHVIEEFGGEVLVDSKFGKGSTFTIRIPLS